MLFDERPSLFPNPETADAEGLVAISDELSLELLVDAYQHGIFPWSEGPVRWYSPDPRAIFIRERIRKPRKLKKIIRNGGFRVSFDTAFVEVIEGCAEAHSDKGEWISPGFIEVYTALHNEGYAHSVEVWQNDDLVGGLYGVQMNAAFSGESMFHRVSNSSKVAFAALVAMLDDVGIILLDAQVLNEHTHRLGAVLVHRHDYLFLLNQALRIPTRYSGKLWPHHPEIDFTKLLTLPAKKA